jgi:hypothetical protein
LYKNAWIKVTLQNTAIAITLLNSDYKTVLIFQKEFGFDISWAKRVPASGAPNATVNPHATPVVMNSRL